MQVDIPCYKLESSALLCVNEEMAFKGISASVCVTTRSTRPQGDRLLASRLKRNKLIGRSSVTRNTYKYYLSSYADISREDPDPSDQLRSSHNGGEGKQVQSAMMGSN
ncbi:hypothetical protein LDENG_00201550 [Lucifuga dentata]|nr:hypothetical protein LDENG_00201550 [Lucifuga dentata]